MSASAFPLTWPLGRTRTPIHVRKPAPFNRKEDNGRYTETKLVSIAVARERLQRELDLLRASAIILSTNVELRFDGQPRSDRSPPADPGVALYFKLKGRDTVLACDKWDRVADNIVAISKHIEALRGIERWGVGTIEQAFAGFQALPAPEQWWQVLGFKSHVASHDEISAAYRRLPPPGQRRPPRSRRNRRCNGPPQRRPRRRSAEQPAMTAAEATWLTTLSGTIRAIGEHTHPELRWKIGGGASLDGDLGFDNLERISLACTLDEEFGIEIPDAAIEGWTFVTDVAATVAKLTEAKELSA